MVEAASNGCRMFTSTQYRSQVYNTRVGIRQLIPNMFYLWANLFVSVVLRCMSFKKDKLKLFMPASSEILPHPDAYVRQEQIWYKCPEHLATGKIGLKYDIWCVYLLFYIKFEEKCSKVNNITIILLWVLKFTISI